jgi:hypothetical protein
VVRFSLSLLGGRADVDLEIDLKVGQIKKRPHHIPPKCL